MPLQSQIADAQEDQTDDLGKLSVLPTEVLAIIFSYLSIADLFKYQEVCFIFQAIINNEFDRLSKKITHESITIASSFQEAFIQAAIFRRSSRYQSLINKIQHSPDELTMDETILYTLTTDDINTISPAKIVGAVNEYHNSICEAISALEEKITEEAQKETADKIANEAILPTDAEENKKFNDAYNKLGRKYGLHPLKLKLGHINDCATSLKTTANTLLLKNAESGWVHNSWMSSRTYLYINNVNKFKKVFVNLNSADLENLDFYYMQDGEGKNMGALMDNASFLHAKLNQSNLDMVNFKYCSFAHANLSGCSFVGAQLFHINFSDAIMTGTIFKRTKIQRVNFTRADLTNASFDKAIIGYINLSNATLTNATFKGANITHAIFLDNVTTADLAIRLTTIISLLKKSHFSSKEISNFRAGLVKEIITAANHMSSENGEALLNAAIKLKSIFGYEQEMSAATRSLLITVSSKATPKLSTSECALIAAKDSLLANRTKEHAAAPQNKLL